MKANKILIALLCGCLMAGCSSNTTSDSDETSKKETETTTEKKKDSTKEEKTETTDTSNTLVSQYATGTYCVAVEGMYERASASRNADVAYEGFQQGVAVEVVEIVAGDDDPNSVWGRLESPAQGYMCIKDDSGTYLMTQEEYANSGILTQASPVEDQSNTTTALPDAKDFINQNYTVIVDVLNVRDSTSTDGNVVDTMNYGDQIAVAGVKVNDDGSVWAQVTNGFACIQDGNGNVFMTGVPLGS